MPSLFKRSNGIYYIIFEGEGGQRKWISTGERKRSAALKKLLNHKAEPHSHTAKVTLSQFTSDLLSFAQEIYSPGTTEIYAKSLRYFLLHCGNISISQINRKHIDLYKKDRLAVVKPIRVNIELRTLRAAFNPRKKKDRACPKI